MKEWMDYPRGSLEYQVGIRNFLRYAFADLTNEVTKPCPCRKCINSLNHDRETVYEHLMVNGILQDYRIWNFHGEKLIVQSHDNISNELHDTTEVYETTNHESMVEETVCEVFGTSEGSPVMDENCIGASTESNVEDFYRLVEEGKQSLYAGCTEFSKLTFLVELFQLKVSEKWSDKSFTTLLDFLRRGYFHLKQKYQKQPKKSRKGGKKILQLKTSAKVFWYFSLKPRLQRLFMSSKTSENMQWHSKKRVSDGVLRHPADLPAWKTFDERYPEFGAGLMGKWDCHL
ncbi:uncharacterized protein [Henckelia pumila]|uniref:uncharacterized protein n=1 Tax=Henckelia pumila TaxID=405737 RepID=UPI003C6E86EB